MTHNGVKATCIHSICENADISAVTLYKYFPSKEAIAQEVADEIYTQRYSNTLSIVRDPNIAFPQKLQEYLTFTVNQQRGRKKATAQEFDKIIQSNQAIHRKIDNWNEEFWKNLIATGRKEKYIADSVSDEALRLYLKAFIALVQQANSTKVIKDNLDGLENMLLYGMAGKR